MYASCTAIVAAAGESSRFGGEPKLFADLHGKPVLAHTLQALQNSENIGNIVIATQREFIPQVYELCKQFRLGKVTSVVRGGRNRLETVKLALREIDEASTTLVAVHDGARPLTRLSDIDAVITQAATYGAAILAVPLKDTVKEMSDGLVKHTLQRAKLVAVQTPQVFDLFVLREALNKATLEDLIITDDSTAVERLGVPVHIVTGSHDNIKITTPEDLVIAASLLLCRDDCPRSSARRTHV